MDVSRLTVCHGDGSLDTMEPILKDNYLLEIDGINRIKE
jgi:hypothetical protein